MLPKEICVFIGIAIFVLIQGNHANSTYTEDFIKRSIVGENDEAFLKKMMENLAEYELDDQMKLEALRHEIKQSLDNKYCPKGVCRKRRCRANHKPRRRHFTFIVEQHYTMGPGCGECRTNTEECHNRNCVSANGFERPVVTVNGQMPGPPIQVCRDDIVVVDVINRIPTSEITIHWHGLTQKGTPYMDGVPFITQCPIGEGQIFRYEFKATEMGTHLWYAQRGSKRIDGVVGAIIIRCAEDPWGWLYDEDKYIFMLQEWFSHIPATSRIPGATSSSMQLLIPEDLLINGKGDFWDNSPEPPPLSRFYVKKGKNHRIRLINAGGLACPLMFQIEKHDFFVIAADGCAIRPVTVNSIVVMPGERYDVIISARQPLDSYWILAIALGRCAQQEIYQRAVLVYEGAENEIPDREDPGFIGYDLGRVLNPLTEECIGRSDDAEENMVRKKSSSSSSMSDSTAEYDSDCICAYKLRSLKKIKLHLKEDSSSSESRNESSDSTSEETEKLRNDLNSSMRHSSRPRKHIKFELNFGEHKYTPQQVFNTKKTDNKLYYVDEGTTSAYELLAGEFNGVSFANPSSLLLGHPEVFLRSRHLHCHKADHQNCLHTLHANIGDLIDIILVHNEEPGSTDNTPHCFHLHGHKFELLYQGANIEEAKDSRRFCKHPSCRDTVVVPAGGVARIRFYADNPGLWMLNSQLLAHQMTGMSLLISVGETKDLPPKPKGFPSCHNFKPRLRPLKIKSSSSSSSDSSSSSSSS